MSLENLYRIPAIALLFDLYLFQSGPILASAPSPIRFTSGHWSPSRPGVFYIAKVDGSVDVWDLLDKTHEPSITQSVSPSAITSIYPFAVSRKYYR